MKLVHCIFMLGLVRATTTSPRQRSYPPTRAPVVRSEGKLMLGTTNSTTNPLFELSSGIIQGATTGILVSEIVVDSDNTARQTAATGAGFLVLQLPWFKPGKSISITRRVGMIIGTLSGFCGAMGIVSSGNFVPACVRRCLESIHGRSSGRDATSVEDFRDWMSEGDKHRWQNGP